MRHQRCPSPSGHSAGPASGVEPRYAEWVYASIDGLIRRAATPPDFTAAVRQRLRQVREPHSSTGARQRWLDLPILCHLAVGGDAGRAIPLAAAFELGRLAANVLDGVEDGDAGSAVWQTLGVPQAINVGTGLVFAATLALADLHAMAVPPETVVTLQAEFARTGWRMCAGQHLDLSTGAGGPGGTGEKVTPGDNVPFTPAPQHPGTPAQDAPLQTYWQIVEAKSGAFFALGGRAGALLGGLTPAECAPYARFGRHLGLLAQIVNDMAGLLGDDGSSDVARGKPTLPVIYAFSVATGAQHAALCRAWAAAPSDARARAEVRRIVVELGAPQYVFVEAERHYRQALASLQQTGGEPAALTQLAALLDLHRPPAFRQLEGVGSAC